jgi:hypothetical protein
MTHVMAAQFEQWQAQQEQLNRNLIAEVKKASRPAVGPGTTAAPPAVPVPSQSTTYNQANPQPQATQDSVPPIVNITGDGPPGRSRRYYAVVKGRTLGIMDSWKSVLASVSGYSYAKYKCFHRRPAAEEWYLQQLQVLGIIPEDREPTEDEDSCCGRTVDLNSVGLPSERNMPPPPGEAKPHRLLRTLLERRTLLTSGWQVRTPRRVNPRRCMIYQ